jgi:hypothetical protein
MRQGSLFSQKALSTNSFYAINQSSHCAANRSRAIEIAIDKTPDWKSVQKPARRDNWVMRDLLVMSVHISHSP